MAIFSANEIRTFFSLVFDFENGKKCPNIMELPIFTTGKLKKVNHPSQQYTDMRKLRSDMKQNAMNFEHFISFYLSK